MHIYDNFQGKLYLLYILTVSLAAILSNLFWGHLFKYIQSQYLNSLVRNL
jgi:hypothetical protein